MKAAAKRESGKAGKRDEIKGCLEEMDTPAFAILPAVANSPRPCSPPPTWMLQNNPITAQAVAPILQAVAAAYGVSEEQMRGPSRVRRICWARHVGIYLVMEIAGASSTEAAFVCLDSARHDHGTALHARKKILAAIDCYPKIRAEVEALKSQILNRKS